MLCYAYESDVDFKSQFAVCCDEIMQQTRN